MVIIFEIIGNEKSKWQGGKIQVILLNLNIAKEIYQDDLIK